MKIQKKLETHYGLDLRDLIEEFHWKQSKSIKTIADEAGIARQSIMYCCKRNGIRLRSHLESVRLNPKRGAKHWAYGKTKATHPLYDAASKRMKKDNPIWNTEIAAKIAISRSKGFKRNPWPQEKKFKRVLYKHHVQHIFQYPIGPYIIDFYIPRLKLCIEIDSTDHWGAERIAASLKKDNFLTSEGYSILRINKSHLIKTSFIEQVLYTNNVICHE